MNNASGLVGKRCQKKIKEVLQFCRKMWKKKVLTIKYCICRTNQCACQMEKTFLVAEFCTRCGAYFWAMFNCELHLF